MKIPITSQRTSEIIIELSHHNKPQLKPYTFVVVTFDENSGARRGSVGQANLHPNDQYDKRIGRKLALSRALKKLDLTRDERRQIWEGLFAKGMRK